MDKVIFGLGVSAVGMVIVFVGLGILILFISLLKTINAGKKGLPEPEEQEEPAPVFDSEPEALSAEKTSDETLIAVITAAIAAIMGNHDNDDIGFTVKRVKRVNNAPAWQRAGREEQTYSRM